MKILNDNVEKLIVSLTVIFASVMAWYVYKEKLVLALTDQSAHLNFSRLVLDSFTPGLSQIGFWPPLLHILMAPATSVQMLYSTGLAGFITLLPVLIMGVVLFYRLIYTLLRNKEIAFIGSIIFLLNPYILYYSVTPMMEVLFISNLVAVAYFFTLWVRDGKIRYILITGIFVSLATLSRFEGLVLLPVVSFLMLIHLLQARKKWAEIEAVGLLFGYLAALGIAFILIFGWVYSGNPLTFSGGGWWLRSPLEEDMRSKGDILLSFQYLFAASNYMLTKSLVIVSFFSFPIFLLFRSKKDKFLAVAACLILFSPFLFDLVSIVGGVPLYVPEFPLSYAVHVNNMLLTEVFFNERYGLYWIGFSILAPVLLLGLLYEIKARGELLNRILLILRNLVGALLILLALHNLYNEAVVKRFKTLRFNIGTPSVEQIEAGKFLKESYDFGKILLTRVDNDPVLVEAEIPLKNYITEGNYLVYDQVKKQPWIFARWVVIYNQSDPQGDRWAKKVEPLAIAYTHSQIFNRYYSVVFRNDKKIIYKINEQAIIDLAKSEEYNINHIPSLNPSIRDWDLKTIYSKIGITKLIDINF